MRQDLCVLAIASVVMAFTGASHAQKSSASSSSAIYSCVDAGGRRLTADRPIAACSDREQQLTLPGGIVRTIGPTYSEKERAEQAVQLRKEAEERYRANDDKRRERALAVRFPTKAAHDAERAESVDGVKAQIKLVQERRKQLLADREQLNLEFEFYKNNPSKAPQSLQVRLATNTEELKETDDQQAALNDDVKRTNQRFDSEAHMLKQYWTPASK